MNQYNWTPASNPPDSIRWVQVQISNPSRKGPHIMPHDYQNGKWYEYNSPMPTEDTVTYWRDFEDYNPSNEERK